MREYAAMALPQSGPQAEGIPVGMPDTNNRDSRNPNDQHRLQSPETGRTLGSAVTTLMRL